MTTRFAKTLLLSACLAVMLLLATSASAATAGVTTAGQAICRSAGAGATWAFNDGEHSGWVCDWGAPGSSYDFLADSGRIYRVERHFCNDLAGGNWQPNGDGLSRYACFFPNPV
jgi:hypothetical protein